MNQADNILFLGEKVKFHPPEMKRVQTDSYLPYVVPTHSITIQGVDYPFPNLKFDHLRNIEVKDIGFKHSHLNAAKDVELVPITEVEDKKGEPNEAKLEMGLSKDATVESFGKMILQKEAGNENSLSIHQDEHTFKNTTALPFEKQYLEFLNKKQVNKIVDNDIKEMQERTDVDPQAKREAIKEMKMSKTPLPRKKKVVVESITPPVPPTEHLPLPSTPHKDTAAPPSESTPQKTKSRKERRKKEKILGDSAVSVEMSSSLILDESQLSENSTFSFNKKYELESILSDSQIKGNMAIPKEGRKIAEELGITIPKGAKTSWLRKELAKI